MSSYQSNQIKPVSYTHLDVYKRQLLGCSLLLNGLQIGARWVMLRELNRNYLLMRRSVLCTEPPREQERESER